MQIGTEEIVHSILHRIHIVMNSGLWIRDLVDKVI